MIEGSLTINDEKLATGDAVKVFDENTVDLVALEDTELILLDVPVEYQPVGVWAR